MNMAWNHKQAKIYKPLPEGVFFEGGKFFRHCPKCGVKLTYGRRDACLKRHYAGSFCKSCGQSKRAGVIHSGTHRGIRRSVFAQVQRAAEARSLPFEITIDDVANLLVSQGGTCAFTGETISFDQAPITGSVDRIDNDLGYTPDNIQLVSKQINMLRGALTIERFKELCALVTDG